LNRENAVWIREVVAATSIALTWFVEESAPTDIGGTFRGFRIRPVKKQNVRKNVMKNSFIQEAIAWIHADRMMVVLVVIGILAAASSRSLSAQPRTPKSARQGECRGVGGRGGRFYCEYGPASTTEEGLKALLGGARRRGIEMARPVHHNAAR